MMIQNTWTMLADFDPFVNCLSLYPPPIFTPCKLYLDISIGKRHPSIAPAFVICFFSEYLTLQVTNRNSRR